MCRDVNVTLLYWAQKLPVQYYYVSAIRVIVTINLVLQALGNALPLTSPRISSYSTYFDLTN